MSIFSELDGIREQAYRDMCMIIDRQNIGEPEHATEIRNEINTLLSALIMDTTNLIAKR